MIHSRLRTRLLLFFLGLLGAGAPLTAQESQPAPESIPGTEHWVAFMGNGKLGVGMVPKMMGLYISSQVSTTGYVEIPNQPMVPFSIDRGEVITISVPAAQELFTSEERSKSGIRVWSRAPVSVYAYNAKNTSGAGFSVRPVSTWGKFYDIVSLPNEKDDRTGELVIVAAHDSTDITITLSAPTHYRNAGEVIRTRLNRGETYFLQGDPLSVGTDLTGTQVEGSRPFGLITGHVGTIVDHSVASGVYPSHVSAMLAPNELAGTEYVSTPLRSTGDRFRALSLARDTRIEFTHYRPDGEVDRDEKLLAYGEVLDINTIFGRPITGRVHWKANKPFSIVQLRKSQSGAAGMPAMINLVPIDRFSIRTTFGTPAKLIENLNFSSTLTVIARADNPDDLKTITIDGRPIHEMAPALLTQRIGLTNLYTASLSIEPGSHTILAGGGAAFTGVTSGATTTGDPTDFYANVLPYWLPQMSADVKAPRLLTTTSPRKGRLEATVTDSTIEYFSGVGSILITDSPGWYQEAYDRPAPDVDAKVLFTAIADPSGPLYAKLIDRDGNETIAKLSDGICFKTATPDRQSVDRALEVGQTVTESVVLTSNPCGDAATILWAGEGDGNARGLIDLSFEEGSTPVSIPAGGAHATLKIRIDATMAPQGTYSTILSVRIDDSTALIPLTITVNAKSAVAIENESAAGLLNAIYPNPVRDGATISLGRALGRGSSVTIVDRLGRMVSDLSAEAAGGRQTLRWNGLDRQGSPVPAGTYFLSIADGAARLMRGITVIR